MNFCEFTHATIVDPKTKDPVRVGVTAELVFAAFWSPTMTSTHVISTGGAIVPVKETRDQVLTEVARTVKSNRTEKQGGGSEQQVPEQSARGAGRPGRAR